MKNKNVIAITLAIIGIIGLLWWGKSIQKSAAVSGSVSGLKSSLAALETFYDFGTISMRNGNVSKEFEVSNATNRDITIKTVATSCMCTTAFIIKSDGSLSLPFKMPGMGYNPPANELIKAGESRIIKVVYDPNAHGPAGVGRIDRFVYLKDSEGGGIQLEIKALVTP